MACVIIKSQRQQFSVMHCLFIEKCRTVFIYMLNSTMLNSWSGIFSFSEQLGSLNFHNN